MILRYAGLIMLEIENVGELDMRVILNKRTVRVNFELRIGGHGQSNLWRMCVKELSVSKS